MKDTDNELLERIRSGGDIYASDLNSNCETNCCDCIKNGSCRLQSTSALRVVTIW